MANETKRNVLGSLNQATAAVYEALALLTETVLMDGSLLISGLARSFVLRCMAVFLILLGLVMAGIALAIATAPFIGWANAFLAVAMTDFLVGGLSMMVLRSRRGELPQHFSRSRHVFSVLKESVVHAAMDEQENDR
jgi:hypothetical protein